jgi:hypothetical protein
MRRVLLTTVLLAIAACNRAPKTPDQYVYVWAGDSAAKASDFLAVIDANPASPQYGAVLASLPTGSVGSHPHHTEAEMPADGHLLANSFHTGKSWLFDLTDPLKPKVLTSFGEVAGFSHPHTYLRLADGSVLATFQYKDDSAAHVTPHMHEEMTGMPMQKGVERTTGGLVHMDERGAVIRSASAADNAIADKHIYPYSVLAVASVDRAVSTTTDMDDSDAKATAQWVQFWKLSDLTLLRSIALKPGPLGHENEYTGEARLLPDGKSVYIHTFGCGLYLVPDAAAAEPTATLVKSFQGMGCGVPILAGHFWLQPVPETHALVSLDITDPAHPREVSTVTFGDDEFPHWIAIDATGRRVVLNSGGYGRSNRLFIVDLDPATGMLAIDSTFKDHGSDRAGVNLSAKSWPHGFTGTAAPHGTVFSR